MKKGRSKISIKYALIPIILFAFVIILGKSFAIQEEVKSITIKSTDPSYENKEKASYKVDKSAEWIDVGKARITFKYSSILKERYRVPKRLLRKYYQILIIESPSYPLMMKVID